MQQAAHFHVQFGVCQRSLGNHAVKVSAYQRCAKFQSGDGRTFNFSRKSDEHAGHLMLVPNGAPSWAHNPQTLWIAAEKAEKRGDAQTARLIEFSIPRAVPANQRLAFARAILKPFRDEGMCVQVDLHAPPAGATDGGEQPHVHALLTMRRFENREFSPKKERRWNEEFTRDKGRHMRAEVARRMNKWMADNGLAARVDHRRNEERGLPKATEPNLPKWQFEKRREGKTPDPLGDLLLQRSARRNGLTIEQAIERLDVVVASKPAAPPTLSKQHRGSIRSDRRERHIAMAVRQHYDLKEWLPSAVAANIRRVQTDRAGNLCVSLNSGAYFVDRGDQIDLFGPWTPNDIDEMVAAIARNRWEAVELAGPRDFKEKIAEALALRTPPVPVTNFRLSGSAQLRVKKALQEREMAQLKQILEQRAAANQPGTAERSVSQKRHGADTEVSPEVGMLPQRKHVPPWMKRGPSAGG